MTDRQGEARTREPYPPPAVMSAFATRRLGYALQQIAELRRKIPASVTQVGAPGGTRTRENGDPLERFLEAIRPAGTVAARACVTFAQPFIYSPLGQR
jgi:hypothetical protein